MITVARLKKEDVEATSKLIQEVIMGTTYYDIASREDNVELFTPEYIEKGIDNPDKIYLVAKDGEHVIGFCLGYSSSGGIFNMTWIGVQQSYRGKKIASALLEKLSSILEKQEIHKIYCFTRTNNKESIQLMGKFGFREVGTLHKHWYKQDYIIWEKLL